VGPFKNLGKVEVKSEQGGDRNQSIGVDSIGAVKICFDPRRSILDQGTMTMIMNYLRQVDQFGFGIFSHHGISITVTIIMNHYELLCI